MNILEVKNLTVSFYGEKIIDNLSFNLKNKENLVILGPNGAGKSMLLKCLLGIITFTGEVKWSKDVKIGYVPQKFYPKRDLPLSIEEFFKFKKVSKEQIIKSLQSVGLNDMSILNSTIGIISSGQLQRVLIAWTLIDNPNVLLFDEPTANVDVEGEDTIYSLLNKIGKERNLTIVLITHDLNIVYDFASVVLCLNKKAVCYGPPQETLNSDNMKQLYGEKVKFYKHAH